MSTTDHFDKNPKTRITPTQIAHLDSLLAPHGVSLLTSENNPDLYKASIARWSLAAQKPAGAILRPSTVEQISLVVQYATTHNIDLATRCGGHSTSGSSSTEGGLLIDLGKSEEFTKVKVDKEKKHLIVGGGCNWGMVDAAGYEAGVVTVGGTVFDTGVGGLTLGGGYGWLSGRYGLVIDNLVSAKLVLANGEVVTASKTENPDLFWAIRGAGHNFGVTVEFVLQGYEYGAPGAELGAPGCKAYCGMLMYKPEQLKEVVETTNKMYERNAPHAGLLGGCIVLGRYPPGPTSKMSVVMFVVYHGPKEEGDKLIKPYLDLQPVYSTMDMHPYPHINKFAAPAYGRRASQKGSTYTLPLDPKFAQKVYDNFADFTENNADARGSLFMWELFEPEAMLNAASNTDMAFGNRGYHFNAAHVPLWDDAANDGLCRQWGRDIAALHKEELERHSKRDSGATMMYGNYDHDGKGSHDLFGANYPRLQSLKAQYDPNNTFDKLFAIQSEAWI